MEPGIAVPPEPTFAPESTTAPTTQNSTQPAPTAIATATFSPSTPVPTVIETPTSTPSFAYDPQMLNWKKAEWDAASPQQKTEVASPLLAKVDAQTENIDEDV